MTETPTTPEADGRDTAWRRWRNVNANIFNTDHLSFNGGYDAGVAAGRSQALEEAADEIEERFRAHQTLGMPTDDWLRARAAAIREGHDR